MPGLPPEIERRRDLSNRVLQALWTRSEWTSSLLALENKCCVYITGSLARHEIDNNSDLDLFVVDTIDPDDETTKLSLIEQSQVLSALDEIRRDSIFHERKFSRGGAFLHPKPFSAMVAEIGDPQDDAKNLFTARILLLVNSAPLMNKDVYHQLRSRSIDAYWLGVDSSGNAYKADPDAAHKPIMFINDLRRWWLSVALNFERYHNHKAISAAIAKRTLGHAADITTDPIIERRIANLKLRHARMLGVYSVIAAMLALSEDDGLKRGAFESILDANPVDRLLIIADAHPSVGGLVDSIICQYAEFLEKMTGTKEELFERMADDAQYKPLKRASYDFHRNVYTLLTNLGGEGILHRNVVI